MTILGISSLVAALGCGLIAGTFFAFSTFVMRALARLAPAEGIRAMQSINVTVLNPVFLGVFIGTGVLSAALAVSAAAWWSPPRLVAGLLYVVGTIGVTRAFNIPRNDALMKISDDAAFWSRYVAEWTAWNHVRGAAALVAAALFSLAL